MIGIPKDLFKGASFRVDFDLPWEVAIEIKKGSGITRIRTPNGWLSLTNDCGIQISNKKRISHETKPEADAD